MTGRVLDVSAASWRTVPDLYKDILRRLDAPDWHGESVDALIDSMIYGGINGLLPPYVIRVHDADDLPDRVASELECAAQAIADARTERRVRTGIDVDVRIDIVRNLSE